MPARRIYFFFIVTCLALGSGGCTRIARLLDLDPNAQPVANRPSGRAVAATSQQTRCCWCVLKEGGRNSVQRYVGRDSCEARSGQAPFTTCRSVEVEGAECALVKVATRGGRLQCQPNPLTYLENGEKHTIATPDDYELTCRGRLLLRAQQARQDQMEADAHGSAAPLDGTGGNTKPQFEEGYCSCGRDPENEGNCRVVKVSRNVTNVLETRARPPGQSDCSREVCTALFNQEDFRANCPRYSHGAP